MSCGLAEIHAAAIIIDKFQCKSDKKALKWSISFSPSGSYPIAISDEGILNIENLSPPEEPIMYNNNNK